MEDETAKSQVPSRAIALLRTLPGKRVVQLTRYSWWPAADIAAECGVADALAFSRTAGPLAIAFSDSAVLGLASDPALNSVVVWDERSRVALPLAEDHELFPVLASDARFSSPFWAALIGQTVMGLAILKVSTANVKEATRPSERGLRLMFGNGHSLIASHGLHDGSDDFAVLKDSDVMVGSLLEEVRLV